jgi:hypothetical protein
MRHNQLKSFYRKSDSESLFGKIDIELPAMTTEPYNATSTAVCTENHASVCYSVLSITPGWIIKCS